MQFNLVSLIVLSTAIIAAPFPNGETAGLEAAEGAVGAVKRLFSSGSAHLKTAAKTAETKATNAINTIGVFFKAPRTNQVPHNFNMMDQAGTHEGRLKIEQSLRVNEVPGAAPKTSALETDAAQDVEGGFANALDDITDEQKIAADAKAAARNRNIRGAKIIGGTVLGTAAVVGGIGIPLAIQEGRGRGRAEVPVNVVRAAPTSEPFIATSEPFIA